MNKVITVKDVTIGEGLPKICIPMTGETIPQLVEEAKHLKKIDFDVIEWRADFFQQVLNIDKVKEALQEIRKILPSRPIIFTFRSAKEGGKKKVSNKYYVELNKAIAESNLVDFIDVELFNQEKDIKRLVEAAHLNNVFVIISNHDFSKTPCKDDILSRMRTAKELGGDIPKIAVMPKCVSDVITLLDATRTMKENYDEGPIIILSMAAKSDINRCTGELFGSDLTFGAAKKIHSVGQASVLDLHRFFQFVHSDTHN
ncbi:MAG: type 3-dehydroquinate dehydratase [Clostridiaceae bacterium]|nr:type 3-dehydroquinate dehydratase [Clostridiaceae bacterium]